MASTELHDKVMLLKEQLASGALKVHSTDLIESLKAVRIGPDGKIDPDTVDGNIRALANAVTARSVHEKLKQTPLRDVQRQYFEILDRFFAKPFAEMRKNAANPSTIAMQLISNHALVEAFQSESGEFVAGIREFWNVYGPVIDAHLEDLQALKSVFGGDMFPSHRANIASSAGLYMDTIVLPDPLISISDFEGKMNAKDLLFFISKHALSALTYREFALAEVDPPIVVIAPQKSLTDDSHRMALQITGEADVVEHANIIFGRVFTDPDEVRSFLHRFSTAGEIVANVADPSRLLFDSEWKGTLVEQIRRFATDMEAKGLIDLAKVPMGDVIWMALIGRMMQMDDVLVRSSRFGGTPLIEAPTSWQYLLWKYEYDTKRSALFHRTGGDVLIAKALQVQGTSQVGVIAGLAPKTIIELRSRGALADLREIIRHGVAEMDTASATSLAAISEKVSANLNAAFSEHNRALSDLSSSKRKFFGVDVSSFIVIGGITIAAASTASVPLGVVAASLAAVVGAPSGKDLWKKWEEIQAKSEALQRSPTGILFRHHRKK